MNLDEYKNIHKIKTTEVWKYKLCINSIVGEEIFAFMFTLKPMRAAALLSAENSLEESGRASRKAREEESAVSRARSRPMWVEVKWRVDKAKQHLYAATDFWT